MKEMEEEFDRLMRKFLHKEKWNESQKFHYKFIGKGYNAL